MRTGRRRRRSTGRAGRTPNDDLARAAGLTVDNGVAVDEHLLTSDPDIVAAGDVANAYHPLLRRRVRVEHWANALNQPAVAAATMLGRPAAYDRLPYFFTDQYDLDGVRRPHRSGGPPRGRRPRRPRHTRVHRLLAHDSRLVAAMNVNVWDVTEPLGRLIRSGEQLDRARLADEGVSLDAVGDT